MKLAKLLITLIIFLIAGSDKPASSAFRYGFNEGEGLFPFSTPACDPRFADPSSVPAYAPLSNGLFLRTSYARPYMIEGLHSCGVASGYSGNRVGTGFMWNRFGIDEYMEDRLVIYCGARLTDWMFTGVRAHADRFSISVGDYSSRNTVYDADSMLLLRPFPALSLAYRQDNIHSIFKEKRRDILFPDSSFGVVVSPERGISCGWNYLRNSDGGVNSWHVRATILPSFSVSSGYARETSTYAVSAALLIKQITVTYGFNYHAYLGMTHRIGIVFNTDVTPFEPFVMHRGEITEEISVDITSCAVEDLMKLSSMTEEHAERIIKFRDRIAPVTERALHQLGLSKPEINEVLTHCTGIAEEKTPDDSDNEKKRWNPFPRKDNSAYKNKAQVKSLFIRLVDEGVPPAAALKIADTVGDKTGRAAAAVIDGLSDIRNEDKLKAKAICEK